MFAFRLRTLPAHILEYPNVPRSPLGPGTHTPGSGGIGVDPTHGPDSVPTAFALPAVSSVSRVAVVGVSTHEDGVPVFM
jgi:hypothetical protein